MKTIFSFFSVFVLVANLYSQSPTTYFKGVYLSDGTPALLKLSDSSLVDIGNKQWKQAETLFTDVFPSAPNGLLMRCNWDGHYYHLINPGELPIIQWGFGRIIIDFSGFKPRLGKHILLWGIWTSYTQTISNKTIQVKTPEPGNPSIIDKKAWWVWEPNPKGWKAGHLEFR